MYPTKKLSEIAKVINGRAYKADELLDSGKTPVLRVGNLFTNNHWYYSDLDLEDDKYCDNGDLIYAWSASFGPFIWNGGKCIYHYHIWKILCSENINKQYLYWYLSYQTKNLSSKGNGVGMIHITKGMIEDLDVLLPPLSTQSRIVAHLDSAFASIDEQISLLRTNIADAENMRKSVLEESLISEDFEIKKIDDISLNIQYGYTGKTKETGKYKLLRITDIQDNLIDWNTVPFVDITDVEAQKYILNVGDIVFARTGATVGKSCTINDEGVGQVFASYLIRVVVKPGILTSEFLQYFFYSKYYWDQIYKDVVGAAQPNFNGSKLKKIQIPLPPLPRQHEIVAHLDRVFAETTALKGEYEAQIRDLETLKQSLLEEAFAGRLVQENET